MREERDNFRKWGWYNYTERWRQKRDKGRRMKDRLSTTGSLHLPSQRFNRRRKRWRNDRTISAYLPLLQSNSLNRRNSTFKKLFLSNHKICFCINKCSVRKKNISNLKNLSSKSVNKYSFFVFGKQHKIVLLSRASELKSY